MLILLFFVSIAAFALVSMAPLDPLQTNVGQAAMGSMETKAKAAILTKKRRISIRMKFLLINIACFFKLICS